ncbi:ATP-binding cassette domain-containing protein [Lactobacillus gigeriorum]|nr:ABC transporter ATP-binding protein [Lactobacillus gigeriorum]CCI87516.1 ABC transporter ATP-binding and membrane spanning protein [Lactobacillus gigeriorum DSM 23908 = CRBIP 24.85]
MVNFKWILSKISLFEILLLVVCLIWGGLEGVANGIVLGKFPSLAVATTSQRMHFLIFAIFIYVFTYTGLYVEQLLLANIRKKLRIKLKEAMLIGSFNDQEDTNTSINRISNDAIQIDNNYFSVIFAIIQSIVAAIISSIYVFKVNVIMAIIFLLFSLLTTLPMIVGKKSLAKAGARWSKASDQLLATANDWISGALDIVQFNRERYFFRKVKNRLQTTEGTLFTQEKINWSIQYFSWLITVINLVGPWAIGFWLMSYNLYGITVSVLLSLTLTANNVVQNIRAVMSYWSAISTTEEFRHLSEHLSLKAEVKEKLPDDNLQFKNVSFAYGDHNILAHTNWQINNHQKIVLVGKSGLGKSTVLNLISSRLKPNEGQVLLGKQELKPTDLTYVSQTPWIFSGTVKDNITLGDEIADNKLELILKKLALWDELGPDPLQRKIDANSKNLSGGQLQRIAVARALLHLKPIVLLDEITANVDNDNAIRIRKLLYETNATIVEVAHHLDQALIEKYHFAVYTIENQTITLLKTY